MITVRVALLLLAFTLAGCEDDASTADASVDLSAAFDGGGACSGLSTCAIDFPCRNGSVCASGAVQSCKSTCYNGPSEACSQICVGSQCCECCTGCSCSLGAKIDCPPGTVCMERYRAGGALEAACLGPDGGAGDIPPWSPPPAGGHQCES